MEEYDQNKIYIFRDKDGNEVFRSGGSNGYVWQSMTEGVPISINENGDWYVAPYLESDGKNVTAHIPSWFRSMPEYEDWTAVSSQIPKLTLTKDRLSQMNNYLRNLGDQGAVRNSLYKEAAGYGIKSPENQEKYYKWMTELGWEGSSKNTEREKAQIEGLLSDKPISVAEIARVFKNMSKEQLSREMVKYYKNAEKGKNGTWTGSEEEMLRDLSLIKILNYVDDNYSGYGDKKFGENDEFQGLLSASFFQGAHVAGESFLQTMNENFPVINWFARAIYGFGELMKGNEFSFEIENARKDLFDDPYSGGGLEGRDAAMKIGDVSGTIGNIAGTMVVSTAIGNFVSGKAALTSPGGFVSKMGDFAKTIPGAMATDFFLHDIPIDLMYFASDWMRTGDPGKAWYNPEEQQPLFGIPIIGRFGPQVSGGLEMNLLGDAMLDVALPMLSILGNTSFKKLDQWTSGGVTRAREKVAVANLNLQEKLTNIPLLGTGWKKFMNYMMGAENANFIREARKAAIIEGSTEPYIKAQNLLTLYNHAGMTDIAPLYKMLDSKLEISNDFKKFLKEADKYGGVSETKVEWKEVKGGETKSYYKVVPDTMPRDVKQVLLDTERLSELRGEKINEGGLITSPARDAEIQAIEERLSKAPKALTDFAERFSQLNKGVEEIGVKLGVTKEEWLAALNDDPRWKAYMTRQALTPGNGIASAGGSTDPANAAILNKSRKGGYDIDSYIDPMLALSMKTEALGRAYAWNERAKALVSFEVAQGKVVAGKGGVETAKRLEEVKAEIKARDTYRTEIGYDISVSTYNKDMNSISDAFTEINDLLHLPEKLNLKSIYNARKNPRIESFVDDFESGKVQIAEGVKESAGLSDSDAAAVIRNTYVQKGGELTSITKKETRPITFEQQMESLSGYKDMATAPNKGEAAEGLSFDELLAYHSKAGNELFDLKNSEGEVDFGVFGITPWKREKYVDAMKKQLSDMEAKVNLEQSEARKAWFKKRMNLIDEEFKAKMRGDQDKLAEIKKKWDEIEASKPEVKTTFDYPELNALRAKINKIDTSSALYGRFNLRDFVDSDNTMKFYTLKDAPDGDLNRAGFQLLANGEARRSLFEKGYDNLTPKEKQRVDKVDKAFTQRLTQDTILYRGEPTGGGRAIKVGEPFDTSSWTFTSIYPSYVDSYSAGLTSKTKSEGKDFGVIYRFHAKEGTPVYASTKGRYQKALDYTGESSEFVLPRGMNARIIGVSKDKTGFFSNKKVATIVDIELDPNSGVTPKLQSKIMGEAKGADAKVETIIPDTITKDKSSVVEVDYSAGVTDSGVPYKYTVENGKITSFEEITDVEGTAAALSNLTGIFGITPETVDRIGLENARAINRTVMFYRDNLPLIGGASANFKMGSLPYWGWVPNIADSSYGWKVVDGHLEAEQYPVWMGPDYRKGNEKALLAAKKAEVDGGFKPVNTATAESTPTHENGHSWIVRLTRERLNRMVDDKLLTLPTDKMELNRLLQKEHDSIQDLLIDRAMKKIGYEKYTEADITRQAATISEYASSTNYGKSLTGKLDRAEVFAEAVRMYQGNGGNSSKFCLAVVEEMKHESERFAVAANPEKIMKTNGLTAPKGLFKDGEYNFPTKVKTDAGRAKWLDTWRQKNPYLGGKKMFTEEEYRKANLWDTYFQKEIRAYNPKSNSSMPDTLAKKNGDFLEDLADTSAKKMVEKIKEASVEGFSEELATMVLSRNSKDVNDAMENFIIQRVNQSAAEIAAKMPGGATFENLTKARATLWSETKLKNDAANMLSTLTPDGDAKNIQSFIDNLFDTQAKGFASTDVLPVETKKLLAEKEKLRENLAKDNAYAKKKSNAADKERTGYVGDVTQMVHYKQGGEDVYVMVSDPVVASILKRPTAFKDTGVAVEALAQASNFIARAYRVGTTSINPLAFIRNVLRDPMQATIQGGFNPLNMMLSPDVFYHTLRNYGLEDKTINDVTTRLRNWAGASTQTAEMRNMGVQSVGSVGYRNRVEKISKKLNASDTKLKKIIEKGEVPLETWETMFRNQIAQQSFIKGYERTKDVNRALSSAMFDASNSTTNFSHAVGIFKRATSTVPYLSSAINGTRSFWVQFNADPVGMVTRLSAGFMVPAMAITAWNLSNDERRDNYLNLPEWYRDSRLVLLDLDGNAFAIPIPEELQQFYGTARRLIEYTNDVNRQSIPMIMARGVFGFMPADVDGYFAEDGSIDWERGTEQMLSGIMPQAFTAIYEFAAQRDTYMGQDLSNYNGLQRTLNLLTNVFGTGFRQVINDVGMMMGVPKDMLIGKNTADTLARDLFGMGFDNATTQFMNMIGKQSKMVNGKETKATGLFAESENLKKQIEGLDKKIAVSSGEEKKGYEEQKTKLIDDFTNRVSGLVRNYMDLYSQTGGLEDWQKSEIVSVLTLGSSFSSAGSDSWQSADSSQAYLDERALAQQRYVDAGLPAGASKQTILNRDNSIAVQAALSKFYGVPKQAATDFNKALKESGLKEIRNEFFDAVDKIYDLADETGTKPDYDMIEKIQARYLQAVDSALIPILNQYGVNILNNNDFIDEVRDYVNGMIPNNDWSQSGKNAKKYISKKEFPLATVDVKKWLIQRYSTQMKDRNIDSDAIVKEKLQDIKATIDRGDTSAAKGKIEDMRNGINKANYYISSTDYQTLLNYYNMVK